MGQSPAFKDAERFRKLLEEGRQRYLANDSTKYPPKKESIVPDDIEYDERTLLPVLPFGHFWQIQDAGKSPGGIHCYDVVRLRRKRFLLGSKVLFQKRIETYKSHATTDEIRQEAIALYRKWQKSEDAHAKAQPITDLYGKHHTSKS